MQPIRSILVLGGGTAGFLTAISLKTHLPDIDVRVLRSKEIGIIGVGEGTTAAFPAYFHGYLKIDQSEFYREVAPVWKLGIFFIWGERPSFNYTFGSHLTAPTPLPRPVGYYFDDNMDYGSIESAIMLERRQCVRNPVNGLPIVTKCHAYHLENVTFVAYLEKVAARLGIRIVEDIVKGVECGEEGVRNLSLASGRSESADLYVDCSGFRSELLGKALNEPFISFSSTLFNDRAVTGGWMRSASELTEPFTVAETMDAGWCWRIDHEHLTNRGYVFSSSFLTDEQAEREFRQKNPKVKETRFIKFISGRRERSWVKNVVAIGNASGFVEPLEATAIATISEQTKALNVALRVSGRNPGQRAVDLFNQVTGRYWDAIRRFLAIHYRYNKRLDTPYWKEAQASANLSGAEAVVEYYQENGPDPAFADALFDPMDQFRMEGYLSLLVGQKVPYQRKHMASESELSYCRRMREANRQQALAAYTPQEALDLFRLPNWRWTPGFYGNT